MNHIFLIELQLKIILELSHNSWIKNYSKNRHDCVDFKIDKAAKKATYMQQIVTFIEFRNFLFEVSNKKEKKKI